MTTLNDAILAATGGPTVNDGLRAWFGATSAETLNDAELRWLKSRPGVTTTTINDAWMQYLGALGYTGTLNDRLLQYWVAAATDVQLIFGGDTLITIPSGPWDASKVSTVTYTVRMDDYTGNHDVWGTNDGQQFSRFRGPAADFLTTRGGVNDTLLTLITTQGVMYDVTESVAVPGTNDVSLSLIGAEAGTVGAAGVSAGVWRIGDRSGGLPWVGIIREFKIFNAVGTLTNHWPIDDNVGDGGTIVDIVGGLNGILTLGSGSWIPR